MKYLIVLGAVLVSALVLSGGTGAAVSPELALSDSAALAPQTTVNPDGSYEVGTVALDTTVSTTSVGSDGYLCGVVQYRATVRGYSLVGIVNWTYRSTFGVHVCHDKVTGLYSLYDEAMDSNFGWGWCGNIVRQWSYNGNVQASAKSYTKGCFTVLFKIGETLYPWAKMTIGGNGGLWVRQTGGNTL